MAEMRGITFKKLRKNCMYLLTPWNGIRATQCDHLKNEKPFGDPGVCRLSDCPVWKRLRDLEEEE